MSEKTAARLQRWMNQTLCQWPGLAGARRWEYNEVLWRTCQLLEDSLHCWEGLPAVIQTVLGGRGWAWNGIYVRDGGTLRLYAAAGPPVCASIDLIGDQGVGSSGMCFDAILMNQTLIADQVKDWPGYVSCDSESNLTTLAGMVCPIRNAHGTPIAVWDLDATQAILPEDSLFFDRLFATLSALLKPEPATFSH